MHEDSIATGKFMFRPLSRPTPHFLAKSRDAWKKSLLYVGLDPVWDLIPVSIKQTVAKGFSAGKVEFTRRVLEAFIFGIIDATAEYVCAFKANEAFYEAFSLFGKPNSGYGGVLLAPGLEVLYRSRYYIADKYPHLLHITDSRRGDSTHTNAIMATAKFGEDGLNTDMLTLNPLPGKDALFPLLAHRDKGCIFVCHPPGPGTEDFFDMPTFFQPPGATNTGVTLPVSLAEAIIETVVAWNFDYNNCLLMIGGDKFGILELARMITPTLPLLVATTGQQPGEFEKAVSMGKDTLGAGLFIGDTRSILYASAGEDWQQAAAKKARGLMERANACR